MFPNILSPQLHRKTYLELKAEQLKPAHLNCPEERFGLIVCFFMIGFWVLFVCLFDFLTKTEEYILQFLTWYLQVNQHRNCKPVGSVGRFSSKHKENFPTCWNKPELLRRLQTDHPGLVKKIITRSWYMYNISFLEDAITDLKRK